MGFLSFLFGNKEEQAENKKEEAAAVKYNIAAPFEGKMCPPSEIQDPTFAEEILGPTVAFRPVSEEKCVVCAPFAGKVTQMFATAHAVTLSSAEGNVEVLLHVGINTVDLNGEGFKALVKDEDTVKAGDPLIEFDGAFLKSKGYELIVPMAVCNAADFAATEFVEPCEVKLGDTVCVVTSK